MAEGNTLVSVDYEIFGKVQKVFFRKYTQEIVKYCVMIFKDTKDRFIWIHLRVVLAKGKGKDQAEGKKLGLVGWVQNTDRGTVQGQLQGPISKVRSMQEWLEKRGSPKSHIDRANFNNEKVISKLDYSDFQIVK